MAPRQRASARPIETYLDQTRKPMNNLLFVLPLLAVFHVGTAVYGTKLLALQDIYLFLRYFGAAGWSFLPAMVIVLVLLLEHYFHRGGYTFGPKVLAGMVVESLLEVAPLIVISHVTGRLMAHTAKAAGQVGGQSIPEQILAAVGAGVYEEFIFRLVLISVSLVVMVDILGLDKRLSACVAIVLGAALFSLYHFSSAQLTGASFPWPKFVFRALAGAYLGVIFVLRGFALAVGSHICWNLYVMVHML